MIADVASNEHRYGLRRTFTLTFNTFAITFRMYLVFTAHLQRRPSMSVDRGRSTPQGVGRCHCQVTLPR